MEAPHKPGQAPVGDGPSKAALKQKKKREARKAKKAEESILPAGKTPVAVDGDDGKGDSSGEESGGRKGGRTWEQRKLAGKQQDDPEKDKKIKNIIKVSVFYLPKTALAAGNFGDQ